jgi:cytochrome c5
MRYKLFMALMLSVLLFSCGKSEEPGEAATTGSDIEEAPVTMVTEVQETSVAAVVEVASNAQEQVAAEVEVASNEQEQVAAVEAVQADSGSEGEAVYKRACISCHLAGAAGAPKVGDATAWSTRIGKGNDALVQSAIAGVPGTAMIARGACNTCSDDEIRAAVEYMVSQSR